MAASQIFTGFQPPLSSRLAFAASAIALLICAIAARNGGDPGLARGATASGLGFGVGAIIPALPVPAVGLFLLTFTRWRGTTTPATLRRKLLVGTLFLSAIAPATLWFWWINRPGINFDLTLPWWITSDLKTTILFCVIGAAVNSTWEELTWRKLLPSLIGESTPWLTTTLLLSAMFGLAHLFALPNGWSGVLVTFLFALAASVLVRLAGNRILPAVCVHFAADLTLLLLATGAI